MFRDLRNQLKTKNFQVILWVILASFIAAGLAPLLMRESKQEAPSVIKVNGTPVSQTEFALEIERQKDLFASFARRLGPMADQFIRNLQETVVQSTRENLIRSLLLTQQAKAIGIVVDPESVFACMNNPRFTYYDLRAVVPMQLYQADGSINYSLVRQYLQRLQLPSDYFERKIEDLVAQQQLLEIIKMSVYITQDEVKNELIRTIAPRTYEIITIPLDARIQKIADTAISDQDLETYYNSHKQLYMTPEKRSASVWKFDPALYNITLAPDAITHYYQEHKQEYINTPAQVVIKDLVLKKPANNQQQELIQNKAAELAARAQANPEEFTQLITQYSQEDLTKNPEGIKELIRGKTADKLIERAAFILDKDLAVSPVVETADGYHIVQRISKQVATYKPVEQVQADIKKILIAKEFTKLFSKDAQQVIDQLKNDEQQALTAFIARKKGIEDAPITQLVKDDTKKSEALFATKKAKELTYYTQNGIGYLIQLTNLQPTSVPELSDTKNQVRTDLKKELAKAQIEKDLESLKEKNDFGEKKLASLSATKKVIIIDPKDEKKNKELSDKGIPLDQAIKLVTVGGSSIQLTPKSGLLIRLVSIGQLEAATQEKEKERVYKELLRAAQETATGSFVASLYRNAKIE